MTLDYKQVAHSTSASAFPSESTTAEPSTVTVNHAKINQVLKATPTLTSDSGKLYPCYLDSSNNIQAMNLQDMKDTFVHPVIDELSSTDNTTLQAGTFFISTSSSRGDSDKQVVSSNTIYTDTRADTFFTCSVQYLKHKTNLRAYQIIICIRTL